MAEKECHKCKRVLPLSAFAKCNVKPDGLQVECRECKKKAYFARKAQRRDGRIAQEVLNSMKAYKPFKGEVTPKVEEPEVREEYVPYSETAEAKQKRAEGIANLRKIHAIK